VRLWKLAECLVRFEALKRTSDAYTFSLAPVMIIGLGERSKIVFV